MVIMGHCVVRAGVALLMAVVMPLSGVPHFDCVCPDGRVKPFCSGRASPDTGCCCGGSCCPSAQGGKCCCRAQEPSPSAPAGQSCCSHKHRLPSPHPSGGSGQVKGTCCHLTLVQAEPPGFTLAGAEANPPTFGFSTPLCQAEFVSLVSSGRGRFSVPRQHHPPPTDLIITLRHLTI